MKMFALLALLLMSSTAITACNTMEGMGKDVEKAGDKVEDTARENKNY